MHAISFFVGSRISPHGASVLTVAWQGVHRASPHLGVRFDLDQRFHSSGGIPPRPVSRCPDALKLFGDASKNKKSSDSNKTKNVTAKSSGAIKTRRQKSLSGRGRGLVRCISSLREFREKAMGEAPGEVVNGRDVAILDGRGKADKSKSGGGGQKDHRVSGRAGLLVLLAGMGRAFTTRTAIAEWRRLGVSGERERLTVELSRPMPPCAGLWKADGPV